MVVNLVFLILFRYYFSHRFFKNTRRVPLMSEAISETSELIIKNLKDAEFKVLVGLIQNKDLLDNYVDIIRPDEFTLAAHKKIFKCIKKASTDGHSINKNLLITMFTEKNIFEDEDACEYAVGRLLDEDLNLDEFSSYLYVTRHEYVKRTLATIGQAMTSQESDSEEIMKIIDGSMETLVDLQVLQTQRGKTEANGRELMQKCMGKISAKVSSGDEDNLIGMSSGFHELDEMYGGFKQTDLIVVAARPAMGKTSLALGMVAFWVLTLKKVVFFSLEMPKEQLMYRLFSLICGIQLKALMNGRMTNEELERLEFFALNAAQILEENLIVDDKPSIKPSYIRRVCAKNSTVKKIDFIVCDYLQLMTSDTNFGSNKTGEVSENSMKSKELAKEFNSVFIQLSQLNRSLEQRADKRPIPSDLRDSGAIEQDADGIIFIYRDVVYDSETKNPDDAELIIGKNRSGPIGTVVLNFDGQYTKFASKQFPVDHLDLVSRLRQNVGYDEMGVMREAS